MYILRTPLLRPCRSSIWWVLPSSDHTHPTRIMFMPSDSSFCTTLTARGVPTESVSTTKPAVLLDPVSVESA